MYYIVRYKEPKKHLKGVKNKTIGRIGPFQTLLEAERMLYKSAKNVKRDPDEGFRLDNAARNESVEFFNPRMNMVYVKTNTRNEFGKRMYSSFTLPHFKNRIDQKHSNPFTQII